MIATAPHSRRRCGPRVSIAAATAMIAVLAGASAMAAATIDRIEPPGGRQGTELEITLIGKNFADPQQLVFEEGRIAVASLDAVDDGRVRARISIPRDCPPGPQRLRLRTLHGLSELRTFRVGLLEHAAETEPNNDPATAQAVTLPRTIAGVVKAEDIDCYRFHLPAGGRISAAIDAIRLDQEMFDACLELFDSRGRVLAACEDHLLLGPDAMLAATVPVEGDYFLRVRESIYGGNDGCIYLLHLGTFPIAHQAWPPAGRPGESLDVEWLGDPAGPFRGRAVMPPTAVLSGVTEIHPERDGVVSPVGVPIRVADIPSIAESEPNDEPAKATAATAPAGLLGRMDAANDVDWYRVAAPKGATCHVRGWGRRIGSPIDLVINAHRDDERRERITGNDDAEGPDSEVRVTVPDKGSFLLRVGDHRRRGGPAFAYWIEVEQAGPLVTVSLPPARTGSQERLVAAVPRGNRTAVVFNALRSDFGGPIGLDITGLPAGVQATAATAPATAPGIPVVFEAATDAPLDTSFVAVTVRGGDDRRPLGGLRQVTELVVGPNNTAYRTSTSDRLPMAVTEGPPIRIDVDPPRVPLVRRGSMDLRVRIERLEGFTGRVKLAFPFRPPGIGAAANVDVPESASEVAYPVNAGGDAALGEWQVVVTGFVKARGKDRDEDDALVSSRPFPIRVGEPLVELTADKAVVDQGRQANMTWKVTKPGAFAGVAKAKLLGLPARAEAPELDLAADAAELVFPVKVAADAPPGVHGNVFCQLRVPMGDEWVIHSMPATQLRIDRPLSPPTAEAKP